MAKYSNVTSTQELSPSGLQIKPIPGSYGIPFFSPIYDRLHYFYFQGRTEYFKSHVAKHNSTVVRLNMPPGAFVASNPRAIAVLDVKSFRVLFDNSKVEKKDVFLGTYMPSLSLYKGIRPMVFLDTTEELHTSLKSFLFYLLASRKSEFIPSFDKAYSSLFDTIEEKLASGPVEFNALHNITAYDFVCNAMLGVVPSEVIGPSASDKALVWLLLQTHPLKSGLSKFLPWPIEDLLFHYFHLPPFLARRGYQAIEDFFSRYGESLLNEAVEKFGLTRHVALHNIIFWFSVNMNAGYKILMPILLKWITLSGAKLHDQLAQEVRSAVQSSGGKITFEAIEKMELAKSVVSEALRLDPPVENLWGHAREDLIIEGHDTAFKVKKGEMIVGHQPLAMRDEKVFRNAEEFIPDRFVGEEGKKLLEHVYWSNGRGTDEPAVDNKQCAGKNMVLLVGRLFIAHLFLRYDTFSADYAGVLIGIDPRMIIKSVNKASYK